MSMRSVPIALVGLGDIGLGQHLPALLRSSDVELIALVDPLETGRAAAASQAGHQVTVAETLDDILATNARGIVLATPPWATPDLAVKALRAGRFVLAEKPVATSVAKAAAYTHLSDDERRRLQIGLTYRHDPAIQEVGSWIRTGRLGSPLLIRAHIYDERLDREDQLHTARIWQALKHGMPVVHEGAHVFDWLSFWLGATPTVEDAWAVRSRVDFPAPNLTGARLAYPGGHQAQVEFGWFTAALPRCEISVLGQNGHALLDAATFRLELSTADGSELVEFPGQRLSRSFDIQVSRFVQLIRGERDTAEPSLADGLAALETAEQVATLANARDQTTESLEESR